jgi:hypothetical protein
MASKRRETTYISVSVAVRRTGLSRRVVEECVERELIVNLLTDADLVELRRIRRLQELGVNMPGIEIIMHMRRRMQALQANLARWERMWDVSAGISPEDVSQRLLPWNPDRD